MDAALDAWEREDAWETRLVARVSGRSLVLFRRSEAGRWLELGHGGVLSVQRDALKELGLRRRRWVDGASAWGCTFETDQALSSLSEVINTLLSVIGDAETASFEVLAQREPPPDNPSLLSAMRRAAATQDDDTRRNLYAALVNATLLVPIDPETVHLPSSEQRPLAVEHDVKGPIWGAFSDWDALRQWCPTGHAFGPVHGVDFFAHAHERGGASVRINPGGFVGGELYPSEVAMMVDAVKRYYQKTMS